jgi:hypothetical protein
VFAQLLIGLDAAYYGFAFLRALLAGTKRCAHSPKRGAASSSKGKRPRSLAKEPPLAYAEYALGRVFAVVAIFVGTVIVGFNPDQWDDVILDLPGGHGLHFHDVVGIALVAVGTSVLWRPPRSD